MSGRGQSGSRVAPTSQVDGRDRRAGVGEGDPSGLLGTGHRVSGTGVPRDALFEFGVPGASRGAPWREGGRPLPGARQWGFGETGAEVWNAPPSPSVEEPG